MEIASRNLVKVFVEKYCICCKYFDFSISFKEHCGSTVYSCGSKMAENLLCQSLQPTVLIYDVSQFKRSVGKNPIGSNILFSNFNGLTLSL
jgi:hypothetical protein